MNTAYPQQLLQRDLALLQLPATNAPYWTPNHATKGVVLAEYKDWRGRTQYKLIRFGNWIHPHNWNEEARADWWKRHGHKTRSKANPRYWEGFYLWGIGCDVRPVQDTTKRIGSMKRGVRP